jgi:hypothetical protein
LPKNLAGLQESNHAKNRVFEDEKIIKVVDSVGKIALNPGKSTCSL